MTALVMSGGGMFGAYQAGVYKVISEHTNIDMVAGCTPEQLIELWRDPGTGKALKWFDSRPLRAKTEELHRGYTPRMPYALAVFQLAGFKTRVVRHPDVTPAHLQASCSIPFMVRPVRIGGRLCVDAFMTANLPVFAAVEMGATRVIAIDVLPGLPQFFKQPALPPGFDLTLIAPSKPLGGFGDALRWKRENIERFIALGIRDANQSGSLKATNSAE